MKNVLQCLGTQAFLPVIRRQQCLLSHNHTPILALDPLNDLAEVFAGETFDVAALLSQYKVYLDRLKVPGIDLWQEQPRRKTDLQRNDILLIVFEQESIDRHLVEHVDEFR